jgi:hypothetical protein
MSSLFLTGFGVTDHRMKQTPNSFGGLGGNHAKV